MSTDTVADAVAAVTESQATAAVRATELHAAQGADWATAVQHTVRALLHRLAHSHGLRAPELPYPPCPGAEAALDGIGPLAGWTVLHVGEVHQQLLRLELGADGRARRPRGATARDRQGSWYTPQPLALAASRLALEVAASRLLDDGDPDEILRLRVVDPACGAGVFLIEGARVVADAYARALAGTEEPPPLLVRKLMPEIFYECVFGVDIDPVAIDLSRMALWLELDGRFPLDWLDGNIACLDPLAGPDELPPRLRKVLGERQVYAA
ncbi:MAG TPA: N-6 DNA methylase [Streptomyces sp.]|nr:N-6 DNA methylase [Streptomyces sp.]